MKTLNYTQSNHTHRLFRRRALIRLREIFIFTTRWQFCIPRTGICH